MHPEPTLLADLSAFCEDRRRVLGLAVVVLGLMCVRLFGG